MKNFNLLNFLIITFFATAQITPATEAIYYEYDAPDETGAMKRQAEKLKLIKNQMIRDELTEAQKEERAVQEAAFKAAYEKQKEIETKETAAKKIQTWTRNVKLKNEGKKLQATIKLQRASRDFLDSRTEKRFDKFQKSLKTIADQMPYKNFNELICTADYITKTDWLYQLIEKLENKKIFERDENGTIDPDKFLPEFKKQVKNPNDWLDQKMIQYLPKFHQVVYEIWIEKASDQIVNNHMSWIEAVSIPTPKGHGSLQAEGEPLFPIVLTRQLHEYAEGEKYTFRSLILANVFTEVFEKDPTRFEQLNISPKITPRELPTYFGISAFGSTNYILEIPDKPNMSEPEKQKLIQKNARKLLISIFNDYLNELGFEISPEEAKAAMISDDYLRPIEPKWDSIYSDKELQKKSRIYFKKFNQFEREQQKFIEDHINWASSARQTFLLGQLIFDHDMQALEKLGGNTWLAKQPEDIAKAISEYKSRRLTNMKKAFEKSETSRFSDLNSMNMHF